MTEESPPSSLRSIGGIVQHGNLLISTSGGSGWMYGKDFEDGREGHIYTFISMMPPQCQFRIRLFIPIRDPSGVNVGEKSFLLALGPRKLMVIQPNGMDIRLKTIGNDEIVDIGAITVLTMERIQKKKEEVLRVSLKMPIVYRSGQLQIEKLTVDYSDNGRVKKSLEAIDGIDCDGGIMKFCINLTENTFFGVFEDTVINSDGSVAREEKVIQNKKKRISVIGKELWNGKVLVATENGMIRVMDVNEGGKSMPKDGSLKMFSSGQCVDPHHTIRCPKPTVIISTKRIIIVGTRTGEIYCMNEQFQLIHIIDTEGGPISCLKLDENDGNFLFVGYESGEVKRIFLFGPDENEAVRDEKSQCKSERKVRRTSMRSDTVMDCPKCEYGTRGVVSLLSHLNQKHYTNAYLAGIVLRCECGYESFSDTHSRVCKIANFTVVRTRDGPIRTFEKTTPQCILCESYPKTAIGYSKHLNVHHQSSLAVEGLFLLCSCGYKFTSSCGDSNHTKMCDGRQYSLHERVRSHSEPPSLDVPLASHVH